MRSKTDPNAASSQNYKRFAWGTLAVATLVALGSTGKGDDPAAAPMSVTAVDQVPKMARPAFKASSAEPEELVQADTDGVEPGDEAGDAKGPAPVLPGVEGSAPEAPLHAAGPASSAQTGQLIASSRSRSGGVAQGDDPVTHQSN
jgi:hypothetical protein